MTPAEVKTAQTNLIKRGYNPGPTDGVFGPKKLCAMMAMAAGRRQDTQLQTYADALAPQLIKGGIIGRYRLAHFLANTAIESQWFSRLVESLHYKDAAHLDATFSAVKGIADATGLIRRGDEAIGNRIYANRNGNGNEASGDGFKYRGRGFLMHTGKKNYADLEKAVGRPLIESPQFLEQPLYAAIAAVEFWNVNGLSIPADRNDAKWVRRGINGAAVLELATAKKIAGNLIGLFQ
ncbi:glycoside hydrolase family 19 protein [Asticcacaulis endophyticus]|uniref:Chitinase n=1 Tax=Asticcacaulis endophyticus TaxID=1395890 RepID=A0A918Q2X3_9CAUL|nr:glycoside hydrolase family 19 protein [Asticcacaulis endophyticus]GGZ32030.1 hypothetical protein GCM10011273_17580 [Asticcacaulis endophyticus]